MINTIEWIVGIYLSIGVFIALCALVVLIASNDLKNYTLFHNIYVVIATIFMWPYAIYSILTDLDDDDYD